MVKMFPIAVAFSVFDEQLTAMGGIRQAHHEFSARLRNWTGLTGSKWQVGTHEGHVQTTMANNLRGLQLRNVPREHDRNQWIVLFSGVWTKADVEMLTNIVCAWEETEDVDSLQLGAEGS